MDIVLLHVTGDDRPGLTSSLAGILSRHDVQILDLNQTVIHNTLLMGMLVRLPSSAASNDCLKDLLFTAHHLGLRLRMNPIEDSAYDEWVTHEGLPRYILTLLTRQLQASHVAAVADVIAAQSLNIDIITRLSGRIARSETPEESAMPRRACVEFSVRGKPADENALQAALMTITRQFPVDIAWQRDNVYRRMRRLVAFDMDSTLIQHEVIDELAREAGVGEKVSAITEAAMRGELDFRASLLRRVELLAGLDVSVMQLVAERLQMTEGAERLLAALKQFGFKTAILSGGFAFFGKFLKDKFGIDYVRTNDLDIAEGKLTGRLRGEIVDAQGKANLLQQIAAGENISLQQTIAVGDGANDLPMLAAAGLGIAFHAKPTVAQSAKHRISTLGLDGILYLIGVRDRDLLDV